MVERSGITSAYQAKFHRSQDLFRRGLAAFPSGVTHDSRYLEPFPVFVTDASGSRKRSVEGHSLIDYWVGHGSLILGHGYPAIVEAVQQQMQRGTHFSACHELEIEWAERVRRLVPSAERVRFTNSGSEATLMALRIARLVTGRSKVVKLIGHFHGWHDLLVPGAYAPYTPDDWSMPGVTSGVLNDLIVAPPNDLKTLGQIFETERPACCILEPTGGHWGLVPIQREYLQGLRQLCTQHGVLLIFDEVITGFRVHPGGAQAFYSISPDLTAMAKILAGGLPGGGLCGRADLLDALAFGNRHGRKMKHAGTFNGNPLSAAAGCAALDALADGQTTAKANQLARQLRLGLNKLFARRGIPWVAYGEFSMIHIHPGYDGPRIDADESIPFDGDYRRLDVDHPLPSKHLFRAALLTEGVDWFGWSGMTSAAHSENDIDQTVNAFDLAIARLSDAGQIGP